MARPKKNNADYFPHDADMRNDPKIRALRRKYGTTGYAVWNMILEILTDSDFFEFQWTELNIELLAGDFDIDPKVLEDIVVYCQEVKLLETDGEVIFTSKLKERFESVLLRRFRQRKGKVLELSSPITPDNQVSSQENEQSKQKENKVNIPIEYSETDFLEDWAMCRKSYRNLPTHIPRLKVHEAKIFTDLQKSYNKKQFRNALEGLFQQENIIYNAMITTPSHFLENFEKYYNAFISNDFKIYGTKAK